MVVVTGNKCTTDRIGPPPFESRTEGSWVGVAVSTPQVPRSATLVAARGRVSDQFGGLAANVLWTRSRLTTLAVTP